MKKIIKISVYLILILTIPAIINAQYTGGNGGGSFAVLTSGQSPLPVKLSSFTSNVNGRNVKLNWVSAFEVNNSGFDVERKVLNSEWEKIGFVKGNGNAASNYSYEDTKLQIGKYSYRLKQIDFNGNSEYHNLSDNVNIEVPVKFNLSQNYPNPFNPSTKIDFALPFDSKVNIVVYDITGREVKNLANDSRSAGYYTLQFDASSLSSGVYFYSIVAKSSNKDFNSVKKMMVVK